MVRQLTRSSPCSQPIIRAATPEQWLPLPPVTQEAVSAIQRQWLPLPPRTRTSKGSRTRHLLSSPFRPPFGIHTDTAASPKTCGPTTHVVVPPPLRGHLSYYMVERKMAWNLFLVVTPHELVSPSIPKSQALKLAASAYAGTPPFSLKEKGGGSS